MDNIIGNKLMLLYMDYLLCKLGELYYKEWSMVDWKLLHNEENFSDNILCNIRAEVFYNTMNLEWLQWWYIGLTLTTTPTSNIFNKFVKEYSKHELS